MDKKSKMISFFKRQEAQHHDETGNILNHKTCAAEVETGVEPTEAFQRFKKRRIPNIAFVVLTVILLGASFLNAIFFPEEINTYENRYANKLKKPTVSSVLDGSFQNSAEEALSDQIPLACDMKSTYRKLHAQFLKERLKPVFRAHSDEYISYMDTLVFGGDQLVYQPRKLEDLKECLENKAENYNKIFAENPDIDFYTYFIEKDTDMNFETREKTGAREYIYSLLELPDEKKGFFPINSYEEFREQFYKTDHHWNNRGSYRGYCDVLKLLGCDDTALVPTEEKILFEEFAGSKSTIGTESTITEPFPAYHFNFPEMNIKIVGEPVSDYGNQEACFEEEVSDISYGIFYGSDEAEIVFENNRPDRENILLIGESYDNALLKLIASHFNTTCSVDLRYYEPVTGKKFSLAEYTAAHDIDKVLFIGNTDFYTMTEFALEN